MLYSGFDSAERATILQECASWNVLARQLVAASEKRTMSNVLQGALFFLLGLIGLGAIGLLPYRSWQLLRLFLGREPQRASRKALSTLALLIVVAALAADLQITRRIYRCLNETYCGPNVASGWIYLSMLGVVFLVFELVGHLMQRADRALTRKADQNQQ